MASSEKFHFEKNTIVTSTTNINKSDVEKYIVENLDNFREGSHFIVMCGFHGSPEGKLLQYDSDFMSHYQSMFNSINRKHENKIKERKYLMGQTNVYQTICYCFFPLRRFRDESAKLSDIHRCSACCWKPC